MSNFLAEALIYSDMGWSPYPAHSVNLHTGACSCGNSECPCPGKHPIGRWLDYTRKTPSLSEIKGWFSTFDCNIGTITGQISGIVVVDVDGKEGLKSIKPLNLEPTLSARTGGGGYHFFYRTFEPAASRVGVLPGVDIRADGAFVVLPPSLHISSSLYKWLKPRPLAPFDAELFKRKASQNYNFSSSNVGELFNGVPEGTRNISAAKLAGRYFGLGLSRQEAWILLSVWNERNNPPLDESELKRTFEAIERKHKETTVQGQIETLDQIRKLLQRD